MFAWQTLSTNFTDENGNYSSPSDQFIRLIRSLSADFWFRPDCFNFSLKAFHWKVFNFSFLSFGIFESRRVPFRFSQSAFQALAEFHSNSHCDPHSDFHRDSHRNSHRNSHRDSHIRELLTATFCPFHGSFSTNTQQPAERYPPDFICSSALIYIKSKWKRFRMHRISGEILCRIVTLSLWATDAVYSV